MTNLDWYFDFVSPFSYLQREQFQRLPAGVQVNYVPVLFGALLGHWGQKGPAEIASKRPFTYRHTLWLARRHGIPMRFPPAHPFNPLKALRLAIALDCDPAAIRAIFRFIWRDGRAIDSAQDWADLSAAVGLADADAWIAAPQVKDALRGNTEAAIARGVFGVPTFAADDQLFWGFDATDMLLDYLRDPAAFRDPEMLRIAELPVGIRRQ
ncbi:MAG: 2-hydroxychromene-2-carboxylate isomerase [Gammaproteobacteria bacterium]